MARNFDFSNDEYEFYSLGELREIWQNFLIKMQ